MVEIVPGSKVYITQSQLSTRTKLATRIVQCFHTREELQTLESYSNVDPQIKDVKEGYVCPNLTRIPHMIEPVNLDKHREGSVTFQCDIGYKLVGHITTNCKYITGDNMASWQQAQPSCSEITCYNKADKGTSYRGRVNITSSNYPCLNWKTFNTSGVNYKEDNNYCRNPDNSTKPWCYSSKQNKRYEYCNIPECDMPVCPSLSRIDNVVPFSQKAVYQYPDYVIVTCKAGYIVKGNAIMHCKRNGQWSTPIPQCQPIVCNKLPNIANMDVKQKPGGYNYSELLHIKCQPGHALTDVGILQCGPTGTWTTPFPSCAVISCSRQSLNLNEYVSVTPNIATYNFNKSVTIACKPGYTAPNVMSQCIGSNRWTETPPACKRITCSKESLNISKVVIIEPDGSSFNYSQTVKIKCKSGLAGPTVTSQCTAKNQWSHKAPNCTLITCSLHSSNASQAVLFEPSKEIVNLDITVKMTCKNGYNGSSVISRCINIDRWSKPPPTCKLKTCSISSLNLTQYNMVADSNMSSYNFNQSVTVACKHGYNGKNETRRCVDTDFWSGTPVICSLKTCSVSSLNLTQYNMVADSNMSSYNFNQSVTVACKHGYDGKNETRRCVDTDFWSGTPVICSPKTCSPNLLNTTEHVVIFSKKSVYTFNESVEMACKRGYSGTTETRRCLDTDLWSGIPVQCTPVPCPILKLSDHMMQPKTLDGYYFGDSVTVQCETGYKESSTVLKCNVDAYNNGLWNDTEPKCTRLNCPNLSLPENLLVKSANKIYGYKDVAPFTCKSGYTIVGHNQLTCEVTQNRYVLDWNGNLPNCTKMSSSPETSLAGPVGGAVGGIVVFIVVIGVIIFIRRRQTSKSKEKQYEQGDNRSMQDISPTNIYAEVKDDGKENVYYNNGDTENGGYYAFSSGPQIPKYAILVKNFYDYVDKGRGENGLIEQEFHKLKSGLQKPTLAALKGGNKVKNKYRNMYPYDETRVVLTVTGSLESDYVNASFIHGPDGVRKYIASQGPLDNTVDDFWRMIWQYDCGKIVMLTNIFENGKHKCIQYWPDPDTHKVTYGETDIILSKEDVYSDFTVRTLKMQKDKKTKTVQQFHFTAWPDKDVPKYASSIVHFRYKVNNTKVTAHGPMVVHCSAGIGRTGTFIALDYVLNQSKELDYVDVFGCVEGLRNQRVNMVQTQHQYMFLHEAVLEAVMCPNTGIPSIEFPDVYKDLMEFDNKQKKSKLLIEYETLNSISPRHGEDVFERGKTPENKAKNRYSNIIPVGSEMPMLSTDVDGHNEYINAVFLPGYRSNKMFIITQMPMESTRTDLWRLVYDYDIPTIVMLNQDNSTENQYWPEKDASVTFGPFEIKQTGGESMDLYNSITLALSYKQKETRKVHLFQSKFWEDEVRVPSSSDDIITLMTKVEEGRDSRGRGPTLVHCLNGCDKSGLYCVMATVIERLRIEQDVDIQHIIKQMRNRRPQIIPNFEQFQFVYEVVMEYMKQFETYSNFQ